MRASILLIPLLVACNPQEEECPGGTTANGAGDCIDNEPIEPPTEGPNWGWVSGAAIPSDASGDATQRVQVPVEIVGLDYGFELGDATVIAGSTFVRVVIPVTNTGVFTKCFVRSDGIKLFDEGGTELVDENLSYARGTAHEVSPGIITNTCLTASQTGYFLDLMEYSADVGDIASATLVFNEQDTEVLPAVSWVARPTAYTEPEAGSVDIEVENIEGGSIDLSTRANFVAFDADGPTWWGFANASTSTPLASGELRVFSDTGISADLAGDELWVALDFEDNRRSTAPAGLDADETARWQLDRWEHYTESLQAR